MVLLTELPDYSNELTRSTEEKLGPYDFPENNYPNLVDKGPFQIDVGTIYFG